MMSSLSEGWQDILKRLAAKQPRQTPAESEALVSFSAKRQKKLSWNLFLCGRSR